MKGDGRGGRRAGAGRPKSSIEKRNVVIKFPIDVYERLGQYAKAQGRTRTAVLCDLIDTLPL